MYESIYLQLIVASRAIACLSRDANKTISELSQWWKVFITAVPGADVSWKTSFLKEPIIFIECDFTHYSLTTHSVIIMKINATALNM